ncbi:FAD-binding oxidoreductase [Sphingomonas bacterium]|uniref:NAD(P)/FAD-dependent oxidoreductase n=1 Tax=Sphingomonas bacterium TaxID=1895847 RepID=UPI002617014A|nr:FAD-binding oxidoreductase [Sphingomonas bacterium]MDB5677198.1 FAD-dependent oxidoreductase [Sphingomonas bacterium]
MNFDIAIIGAGIAGASLAAEVAPHASVLVLEAEDVAGYHATGRSAAFWEETYGGPAVQPLSAASRGLLDAAGFLQPLGSLHIGREEERELIDGMLAQFAGTGVDLSPVDPRERIAGLRPEWNLAVWEPSCAYIDVAALHAQALSRAKKAGAALVLDAALTSATRTDGVWRLETKAGAYQAKILVNAAGAWVDRVAAMAGVAPIGIAPFRRTLVQLRVDPPVPDDAPHVAHIGGDFYFKPEAGGRLWLSPHDEIPSDPGDVQPEELDIAIAIDRLEHAVDWRIERVERSWAGLRSFAPDRLPVYGFDNAVPGFFWCAGQGGFGIQTAPAASLVAASLLLGTTPDPLVAGIDRDRYSPARFR